MTQHVKFLAGTALMLAALVGFSGQSRADSGEYCREYTRTVYIGNQREEAYGTACLRPDGQWEIVDEDRARPVNYAPAIKQTRTVYVPSPTQVVYYNRQPTRLVFVGNKHYKNNYRYYKPVRYDRHNDRHDRGRGRGHGHYHR